MSLSLGNTTIGSLYLGSTKIGEAYLGSVKVWEAASPQTVTVIGGKTYPTCTLPDGHEWLALNLDFKFSGLVIGQESSSEEPRANYYDNDESTYGWNGNKYGLMYNWIAVKYLEDHKSELIPGWHVPTVSEMNALKTAVGASPGTKLKSTTGWINAGNGTDDYGFAAFPAGYQYAGGFDDVGGFAGFWTAVGTSSTNARVSMFNTGENMNNTGNALKSNGYSVRLIRDY